MAWLEGFRDRVVVITGASSGIGRAAALAFGAAGARLGLVARRQALLDEVAALADTACLAVPTDVTDRDAVQTAFAALHAHFGRIDVVVNNAGILIPSLVGNIAAGDLDAMLRVNLFGALYVMQESVRIMRAQQAGSIVNVGSLASRRGVPELGGYCATKFALVGLTESLRSELHGEPIHVGLVLPGVVETPMVEGVSHDQEFLDLWPSALNMPPSWVVWAIFASVRFRLVEVSVPPGAGTIEKLASLSPGVADSVMHWARSASHWLATRLAPPSE
jgi:NAD(P)-dependent dehydrogenase (short-subunit alcohol dehydrogenase family)